MKYTNTHEEMLKRILHFDLQNKICQKLTYRSSKTVVLRELSASLLPESRPRTETNQALGCSSTARSCTIVIPPLRCAGYNAGDFVVQTLFVL